MKIVRIIVRWCLVIVLLALSVPMSAIGFISYFFVEGFKYGLEFAEDLLDRKRPQWLFKEPPNDQ